MRSTKWKVSKCLLTLILFGLTSLALGQETRQYQFAVAPLEIFDQLTSLKIEPSPELEVAERKLLERRWQSGNSKTDREDSSELLDAMLFASGAKEAAQRDQLKSKYLALAKQIKGSLKSSDAKKQAEVLLTTLHQTAMKGGYDLECTSLVEIFSSGKFNCVSSTALYYLLGRELELKLQPISIPGSDYQAGHATLDLIVGEKRIQIEPTNENGFEWDVKLSQPGVISLNFGPPRNSGYDVAAWALPAMIYSNRGNKVKSKETFGNSQAALCYIAALCMFPTDETANRNLLATFTNWGPELTKAKRFDDAINVMEFAHKVAPTNRDIDSNRRVVWIEKINQLIDERKDAEAVATIRSAAKAMPEESDFRSAMTWFNNAAHKAYAEGKLDGALKVVDRAMGVLDGQKDEVLKLRTSFLRLQSQAELEKKDIDASLAALLRFGGTPEDRELAAGIAFHTQEALKIAFDKGGAELAVRHISQLRDKLPTFDSLQKQFENFAKLQVQTLVKDQRFDQAFMLVEKLKPVFPTEEGHDEFRGLVFMLWGEQLQDDKKFKAAYEKLLQGIEQCPRSKQLPQFAESCIATWGASFLDQKKWDEAIEVYQLGLKTFPNSSLMKNNIEYCQQEKNRK